MMGKEEESLGIRVRVVKARTGLEKKAVARKETQRQKEEK